MSTTTDLTHPSDLETTTEGCRFCWMCRQACPVGHVTRRETLTPHGWGLLISSERRGMVSWTDDDVVQAVYSCADCGLCQTHCATDQPLPDAIAAARAAIVAAGAAPATVTELHERLARWGNPYAEVGEREAPARGAVALFAGDAAVAAGRASLDAALSLLRRIGVTPVVVGEGRANGHLASTLGYPDTARAQATALLEEIAATGAREVLVLTPGDRFAFTRLYGERLGVTWPAEVAVQEVSDVLAAALARGRLSIRQDAVDVPYAYYDPEHAPRVAREREAPRTLARALLGAGNERRLFWREGRAHPSGIAGALDVLQPAIAAQLTEARWADATDAGARRLVTEDVLAARQLRAHAPDGADVLDLYQWMDGQAGG